MTDVFLFDALRTPRGRGKTNGALYQVKPVHLLTALLRALAERHALDPALVEEVIIGCVTPTGDQGFNLPRTALLAAGWGASPSGMQINRYCPSGLDAVNLAAAKIAAGWEQLAVAGGVESMSRAPMGSDGGPLMYDPEMLLGQQYLPQGLAADLIATRFGFSREELDAFALQSQERALHAQREGYFAPSLVAIRDQAGLSILEADEIPRAGLTLERLAELRPSFAPLGKKGFATMALHRYPALERLEYHHTAGNSSALADGAGLVLLGNAAVGERMGWKPRARLVATATASVDATICLTATLPATEKALTKAGLTAKDIDLWECNEAFAAVATLFQRHFELPADRLNVNGGAIALGHPLGATGAILLGTLLDELERRDLRTGLVTLCGGGGLATSTIIERV